MNAFVEWLLKMADIPIRRKRPPVQTFYLVCTVLGYEEAYIVHSHGQAEAIVALSREPGRAPKRIVSQEEFERVLARITAREAAFQAAKEREIAGEPGGKAPEPSSWIERSAKED